MDLYTALVCAILGVWALSAMLSIGFILMVNFIGDQGAAAATDDYKKAWYLFYASTITNVIAAFVLCLVIYMTWLTAPTAIVAVLAIALSAINWRASSARSDLRRAEADRSARLSAS